MNSESKKPYRLSKKRLHIWLEHGVVKQLDIEAKEKSFFLCALVCLVGCIDFKKRAEENAKKAGLTLSEDQRVYFLHEYSGEEDQPFTAAVYIQSCIQAKELYASTAMIINPLDLPASLEAAQKPISTHLGAISTVWSTAIDARRNFSLQLPVYHRECERVGVFAELSSLQERIAILIRNAKRHDQNIIKAYGILSQLIGLAKTPNGALVGFNHMVSSLEGEFARKMAIAKLNT